MSQSAEKRKQWSKPPVQNSPDMKQSIGNREAASEQDLQNMSHQTHEDYFQEQLKKNAFGEQQQ
jgi:hypothetical protein